MDGAERAREEGRAKRGRAGGRLPSSNLDWEPGSGAGVEGLRGGGSGLRPRRASGLCRGARLGRCGPGRGGRAGRAEAPGGAARVPGETALVSQLPPRPPLQGWRRGGRWGWGGGECHSEFPATFPVGGKGPAARRSQD